MQNSFSLNQKKLHAIFRRLVKENPASSIIFAPHMVERCPNLQTDAESLASSENQKMAVGASQDTNSAEYQISQFKHVMRKFALNTHLFG